MNIQAIVFDIDKMLVTKNNSLTIVASINIPLNQVMAFGDGDIVILSHVGNDMVKDAANDITNNVEQDNIYNILIHFKIIE